MCSQGSGSNRRIYEDLGVRPLINARGTFTAISGSVTLPEVKQAMEEASYQYVDLDELMEAVGQRLSEITKAEWGVVTCGCEAGIVLATAACIAGTDPEKSLKLPELSGIKNKVIIPSHSRNPYEIGMRLLGVELIEVDTLQHLAASLDPLTAMVYILASPKEAEGPLNIANICSLAKVRGVPVFVDAAAEELTIPNMHLTAGATFVGYSGGKCMRGPQSAGLLLGQKHLVKAAWFQGAPHHTIGRSMKVGKEEIMGMLAATEMWLHRDHESEWVTWEGWLFHIEAKVGLLPSVTTEHLMPKGLSNRAPQLRIRWDSEVLKITGVELASMLNAGSPRIQVAEATGTSIGLGESSITIMPYMMEREQYQQVAKAIYTALSAPPLASRESSAKVLPCDLSGRWDVQITYQCGSGNHHFYLEQQGSTLYGTHHGEIHNTEILGISNGDKVNLRSIMRVGGNEIEYQFSGAVKETSMGGEIDLGKYGHATWSAVRSFT